MNQHLLRVVALAAVACSIGLSAAAAEFSAAQRAEIVQIVRDALRQDPSILRDAVGALQAEESGRQKAALAAAKDQLVDPADPVVGNPQGDVTIVEFFDVRCPYCRKLEPTMAQLLTQDRGVRVVYKDLPILGPTSVIASKALLAAQRQGGYEKLRDTLMAGPPQPTMATIRDAAQRLGLDWKRLEHDMDDPGIQARINKNLQLARSIGIDGTPALVIGGELIPGAVDVAELKNAVAAARTAAK